MTLPRYFAALLILSMLNLGPRAALAEPYLAVQQGLPCAACHVNPTGGGLRNEFGAVFAQQMMPMQQLPQNVPQWTGRIGDLLRLGADVRSSWSRTEVPHAASVQQFQLDQARVYGASELIPSRLLVYLDEALAPGNAQTEEAYVRYGSVAEGWYAQFGKFYLPFGWRLQDNTAFVREVTGISMTTPDSGLAVGFDQGPWATQLVLSNGAANAQSGSGHQVTAYSVYTRSFARFGLSVSETHSSGGNRYVYGTFTGLRTGPVALLGEIDLVRDSGFPEGTRTMISALAEADWRLAPGNNLKLTTEYYDPDRHVSDDQKVRYSILYELTPVPFLQLRVGFRRYRGIPQNDPDNRRLSFVEVHGFF